VVNIPLKGKGNPFFEPPKERPTKPLKGFQVVLKKEFVWEMNPGLGWPNPIFP